MAETGAALKKEWVRAEKKALAPHGFRAAAGGRYVVALGDDWTGGLTLPKRAGGAGTTTVHFDPPNCSVTHVPTQRLIRELSGFGPKAPEYPTLPGAWRGVPPADVVDALRASAPSDPDGVAKAVAGTDDLVRDHVLPWMRAHADLDALAAALDAPLTAPDSEAQRLQSLAVVSHWRGDDARARALTDEFAERFGATGIAPIDEPRGRFAAGFRDLLGGA